MRGVLYVPPPPSPITYIEKGIKRFFYILIVYPNICFKKFSFLRVLRKSFKIWPFSKKFNLNSSFLNIFQKFLQKWTWNTLFTLFWYPTLHIRFFTSYCFCMGFPGGHKIFKKNISKNQFNRFFFIKAKTQKKNCTGFPKSALRGVKLLFFIGATATKRQNILGMGF